MKLPILDNKGNSQGEVEVGFSLIENGRVAVDLRVEGRDPRHEEQVAPAHRVAVVADRRRQALEEELLADRHAGGPGYFFLSAAFAGAAPRVSSFQ